MTEAQFWNKIRQIWPGYAVRVEASEGGVDPGTPDTNLSVSGRGRWVELKVWPEPVNVNQLAWHADAEMKGSPAELWCWIDGGLLSKGFVWVGRAEDYDRLVRKKERPKGVPLKLAVARLAKNLLSKAEMV